MPSQPCEGRGWLSCLAFKPDFWFEILDRTPFSQDFAGKAFPDQLSGDEGKTYLSLMSVFMMRNFLVTLIYMQLFCYAII